MEVSEFNCIVLLIADKFVGSFDLATGLSTFRLDAVIDFSANILINGFNELGTVVLSLISENPSLMMALTILLLFSDFSGF